MKTCKICGYLYIPGESGTVYGCDECTGTIRDEDSIIVSTAVSGSRSGRYILAALVLLAVLAWGML